VKGFEDRIAMSQRERDVLKVVQSVADGKRSQAEAARLLDRTARHIRRLVKRLSKEGDEAFVHGLRGRPSNRRLAEELRAEVLEVYGKEFGDFGPTLASEKLAGQGLKVSTETLRQWLLQEGLWQRQRKRDVHRSRRPRRSCFGELIQMDTSVHDWLESRGEEMVLVALIDDATSRIEAGFYEGETVEAYMDMTERWLRRHGRPRAFYTDKDSVFQWQSKGRAAEGLTQFGRALQELDVELILAHSPQAKGRVERLFGTAQDRWVKELRLAKITTRAAANELVRRQLVPEFNRRFTVRPTAGADAHRALGRSYCLPAILSVQTKRVVTNDYTIRWHNHWYQLHKPALPGLRGGQVIVEERRDGTRAIRFREQYLKYHEIEANSKRRDEPPAGSSAASSAAGSLRSPSAPAAALLPAPSSSSYRPSPDHPWRRGLPKK
jgi:transposase-like protein